MERLGPVGHVGDPLEPYVSVDRPAPEGRPWVLANMVGGLDGSASIDGRAGGLSDPVDRRLFLRLRSLADVIFVGASTVRAEDYGPARLATELVEARVVAGRTARPRLAIVSGSLDLDPSARVFERIEDDPPPLVFTSTRADPARLLALERVAEVRTVGVERVDLPAALADLAAHGAAVVASEGGPRVLGQLVSADVLDELCLTLAPVAGGDPLPVMVGVDGPARFRLEHVLMHESTLFLRYERAP